MEQLEKMRRNRRRELERLGIRQVDTFAEAALNDDEAVVKVKIE